MAAPVAVGSHMPQGPWSPWGELLGWHASQVVGISHLQHAILIYAEHSGPLHTHQHTFTGASQDKHLDLQGMDSGLQEGQISLLVLLSPHPLPLCLLLSKLVGAAVGRPSSGQSRSHRRARGCLPALPGTRTDSAATGESRVSLGALGSQQGRARMGRRHRAGWIMGSAVPLA